MLFHMEPQKGTRLLIHTQAFKSTPLDEVKARLFCRRIKMFSYDITFNMASIRELLGSQLSKMKV